MKNISALIRATIATIWLTVVMTIVMEYTPAFKVFLTSISGHHWTTKGIFDVVFFLLVYLLFSRSKEPANLYKSILCLVINTILAGCVIFGFFLWHFLQ